MNIIQLNYAILSNSELLDFVKLFDSSLTSELTSESDRIDLQSKCQILTNKIVKLEQNKLHIIYPNLPEPIQDLILADNYLRRSEIDEYKYVKLRYILSESNFIIIGMAKEFDIPLQKLFTYQIITHNSTQTDIESIRIRVIRIFKALNLLDCNLLSESRTNIYKHNLPEEFKTKSEIRALISENPELNWRQILKESEHLYDQIIEDLVEQGYEPKPGDVLKSSITEKFYIWDSKLHIREFSAPDKLFPNYPIGYWSKVSPFKSITLDLSNYIDILVNNSRGPIESIQLSEPEYRTYFDLNRERYNLAFNIIPEKLTDKLQNPITLKLFEDGYFRISEN